MENIAPPLQRNIKEINENRRKLLQKGHEVFPENIKCDKSEFNWDEPKARINIFDIYYLDQAGYVSLCKTEEMSAKTVPFDYTLTAAGIDLLENPGEIDNIFPIINISDIHGNVTVGNGNIVSSSINALNAVSEMGKTINLLEIPPAQKKSLLDKLQSVTSIIGTLLNIGKTFSGS